MKLADARSCGAIEIVRWLQRTDSAADIAAIERIFFGSAATRSFASAAVRAEFQERWLGRYLRDDPGLVYLAVAADGTVAGYLVGSVDDPAVSPRFADIGYFERFAEATRRFPAHLHINLDERYRSRGIGGRLIEAFATEVAQRGVRGLHVVTARGARNVGFYNRVGFAEVAGLAWDGRELVMLGRPATRIAS